MDAIGKDLGDDFREGKLTLPVIRAIAAGNADELAFWDRTIAKGRQAEGDLDQALAILARHGTMATTRATAIEWAEKAKTSLTPLPDHEFAGNL